MSATYERTRHLQVIRLENSYSLQYEYILAKLENVHSQKKVFLRENFVWSDACADLKSIEACTTAAKFVSGGGILSEIVTEKTKLCELQRKLYKMIFNQNLDLKLKRMFFDVSKKTLRQDLHEGNTSPVNTTFLTNDLSHIQKKLGLDGDRMDILLTFLEKLVMFQGKNCLIRRCTF